MTLLDKLIQLLHHGALKQSEICLQLGVDWNDIKETVGIMRMRCWVVSNNSFMDHNERIFTLTPKGKEEFARRVKEASKK